MLLTCKLWKVPLVAQEKSSTLYIYALQLTDSVQYGKALSKDLNFKRKHAVMPHRIRDKVIEISEYILYSGPLSDESVCSTTVLRNPAQIILKATPARYNYRCILATKRHS